MPRKSLLSAAITQPAALQANENTITAPPAEAGIVSVAAGRKQTNKGKYHLGGYYDHEAPEIEAFRVLSAKTRKSQQDLLLEAVRDLIEKYEAESKFGRKSA